MSSSTIKGELAEMKQVHGGARDTPVATARKLHVRATASSSFEESDEETQHPKAQTKLKQSLLLAETCFTLYTNLPPVPKHQLARVGSIYTKPFIGGDAVEYLVAHSSEPNIRRSLCMFSKATDATSGGNHSNAMTSAASVAEPRPPSTTGATREAVIALLQHMQECGFFHRAQRDVGAFISKAEKIFKEPFKVDAVYVYATLMYRVRSQINHAEEASDRVTASIQAPSPEVAVGSSAWTTTKRNAGVVFSGELDKKRVRGIHGWQKRHFVLSHRDEALSYYRSEASLFPLGFIPLNEVIIVQHLSQKKRGCRFDVVVSHRVYALKASTRELALKWVQVITFAIRQLRMAEGGAGAGQKRGRSKYRRPYVTTPKTPAIHKVFWGKHGRNPLLSNVVGGIGRPSSFCAVKPGADAVRSLLTAAATSKTSTSHQGSCGGSGTNQGDGNADAEADISLLRVEFFRLNFSISSLNQEDFFERLVTRYHDDQSILMLLLDVLINPTAPIPGPGVPISCKSLLGLDDDARDTPVSFAVSGEEALVSPTKSVHSSRVGKVRSEILLRELDDVDGMLALAVTHAATMALDEIMGLGSFVGIAQEGAKEVGNLPARRPGRKQMKRHSLSAVSGSSKFERVSSMSVGAERGGVGSDTGGDRAAVTTAAQCRRANRRKYSLFRAVATKAGNFGRTVGIENERRRITAWLLSPVFRDILADPQFAMNAMSLPFVWLLLQARSHDNDEEEESLLFYRQHHGRRLHHQSHFRLNATGMSRVRAESSYSHASPRSRNSTSLGYGGGVGNKLHNIPQERVPAVFGRRGTVRRSSASGHRTRDDLHVGVDDSGAPGVDAFRGCASSAFIRGRRPRADTAVGALRRRSTAARGAAVGGRKMSRVRNRGANGAATPSFGSSVSPLMEEFRPHWQTSFYHSCARCRRTSVAFADYLSWFCTGKKFTIMTHNVLKGMLVTPTCDFLSLRDVQDKNFAMRSGGVIVNDGVWVGLLQCLVGSPMHVRRHSLKDINSLLVPMDIRATSRNCESLGRVLGWQNMIFSILSDVHLSAVKESNTEAELHNKIFQYCMNMFTSLHYQSFVEQERAPHDFESTLAASYEMAVSRCTEDSYGVPRTLLSALLLKIASSLERRRLQGDLVGRWQSLAVLVHFVKVFVFGVPMPGGLKQVGMADFDVDDDHIDDYSQERATSSEDSISKKRYGGVENENQPAPRSVVRSAMSRPTQRGGVESHRHGLSNARSRDESGLSVGVNAALSAANDTAVLDGGGEGGSGTSGVQIHWQEGLDEDRTLVSKVLELLKAAHLYQDIDTTHLSNQKKKELHDHVLSHSNKHITKHNIINEPGKKFQLNARALDFNAAVEELLPAEQRCVRFLQREVSFFKDASVFLSLMEDRCDFLSESEIASLVRQFCQLKHREKVFNSSLWSAGGKSKVRAKNIGGTVVV